MTDRRNWLRAALIVLAGATAMSGCSVFGAAPQNDTYELASIAPVRGPYSRSRQIVVTDPSALKSLDGANIVIRTSPSSIQYLAKSQWNDNLPAIVQEKLIEAFEDSGRLGGVGKPGDGLAVDFLVSPSIRAFEVTTGAADTAIVEISVRIVNDRNGVVRAQKVFRATAPVRGVDNEAFVAALNQANGEVIEDIVKWTLRIV